MENTDENEIFEKNIKLAYMVAHRYKNYPEEKEDIFQIALEGLWLAVKNYDKDKSKFSTFAVRIMTNNINSYLRSKKKDKKTVYLYDKVSNKSEKVSNNTYMDFQTTEEDFTEDVENNIIAKELISKLHLTKNEEEVYKYWIIGKNQIEIARIIGVSQPSVSRIITRIKNKLKLKE